MSKNLSFVAVVVFLSFGSQIAYGQACPTETWCEYNGHWYRSTSNRSTWDDAELVAIQLGGHLVTITDADENTWLAEKFPFVDSDPQLNYWVGFYQDTSDGTYSEPSGGWKWVGDPDLCRWTTGNPDVCYTSWNSPSGEPNDGNPEVSENHATLHWGVSTPGGWNDLQGNVYLWFGLVERETDPAIPAVSTWGLIVMMLLLATIGTVMINHRRRVSRVAG